MPLLYPSMEDLPEPVMVDILSRLPVKTIVHCKCVCKKWLNIVLDSYFADLQLSRSPACFMIYHNPKSDEKIRGYRKPGVLKWVEVEDKPNHHNLHNDPVVSLDLNLVPTLQESLVLPVGSVNGLICLWQYEYQSDNTYICNPITREYMILPKQRYYKHDSGNVYYGFGVGSLTREYKVIRIFQWRMPPGSTYTFQLYLSEVEVYSLGTGQWRSLGHVPYWLTGLIYGPFLYGHAHWNIGEQESREKICAFNFDNETFELFPSPPSEAVEESGICSQMLGVLKGCLSLCDTYNSKLTVWVMKEYGIKKSWHKELVIEKGIGNIYLPIFKRVRLVEAFKDGTILMGSYRNKLFFYCPQRKTIEDTKMFDDYINGLAYCPSFHRLCNFGNERVYVL